MVVLPEPVYLVTKKNGKFYHDSDERITAYLNKRYAKRMATKLGGTVYLVKSGEITKL